MYMMFARVCKVISDVMNQMSSCYARMLASANTQSQHEFPLIHIFYAIK